jgi:hypothetical protein
MLKSNPLAINLLWFLLIIANTYAKALTLDESFYNELRTTPSFINTLTDDQIRSNIAELEKIPGAVQSLGASKLSSILDKLSPIGLQQLTPLQLTYQNPDGTLNFDKITDKNLLNPDVRNEVLKQLGKTTETITTNTNNAPTEIESTPNGFFIPDNIYQFSIGDLSVSNGRGIRYENNVLTIEEADTIQIKDGIIVQARNFTGNSIEFSVGRAETVIIERTTIFGVMNSSFEITEEGIRIESHSDAPFAITDSSYISSTFKGEGTIIIETPANAKNVLQSFSIEELAQWVEEAIAAVPQDAMVIIGDALQSAKSAALAGTPLYYDVVTHALSTVQGENGVLVVYDTIEGKLTPAPLAPPQANPLVREAIAELSTSATIVVNGISLSPIDAAQGRTLLYYDASTNTITTEHAAGAIALSYDAATDTLAPAPVPATQPPLPKQLVEDIITIVEEAATAPTVYTIRDGILAFEGDTGIQGINEEYNETIDASNSSAIVVVDAAFGVACLQLMPKSAYQYVDPIIEKDFTLYVPAHGAPYALCLKKSAAQELNGYEGIVDFTLKEMRLNNVITYKRYPMRNNKITDILTTEVYEGMASAQAELRYLPEFILLDSVMLHGAAAQPHTLITRTKPSNYYTITQETLDGEKKRLVSVNWKLTKEHYTQSIPQSYAADDGLPKLTVVHNVLIQDNGKTRTTILPPEHDIIKTLAE